MLTDSNGVLIDASIAPDGQWRLPIHDSLPEKFKQAIIAYEDKRFYSHIGVDILALSRAVKNNLSKGHRRSGASTLSMQVIRLSRKGNSRTLLEKFIEMVYAVRLDIQYSKKEILKLYAAHAPFGGNVVGLETASWRYFGRSPHLLSWAETCMLAVLPNSPALIHPGRNRDALLLKRNALLAKLYTAKIIDSSTYALSCDELLPPAPYPIPHNCPHLLARYQKERDNDLHNKKHINDYSLYYVKTTVNKDIQERAEQICTRHQMRLSGNNIRNIAAIVIDIKSNSVLSYIGNIKDRYVDNDYFVDCINAPRSTGSTLKPFLYTAMNYNGIITPYELIADVPTRIAGYAPRNFSRTFEGAVHANEALAKSLNVPAVRMLYNYSIDKFYGDLQSAGMSTLWRPAADYGLTLILGGCEGTLWDLTTMYAGMARTVNDFFDSKNRYAYLQPDYYQKQKSTIKSVKKNHIEKQNPFDAGSCWLTLNALLDVNRPDMESSWKEFLSSKRIAWKTGTSYGYRDGWAIGVTPKYCVGVWIGNAGGEGRPNLTGISTAAPVLFELFGLLNTQKWFEPPEMQLTRTAICRNSGCRAGGACREVDSLYIHPKSEELPLCSYCKTVFLDKSRKWRIHSNCESLSNSVQDTLFTLSPVTEYYYRKLHSHYKPMPAYREDCLASMESNGEQSLALIYPRDGNEIYIPLELNGKRGRVILEATHRNPSMAIHWHLDREYIGTTLHIHQMAIEPSAGKHTITLVDELGETAQSDFTVLEK